MVDNAGNACRGVCGWVSCPDLGFPPRHQTLERTAGITPMPVESMIDRSVKRPAMSLSAILNARTRRICKTLPVLLIWQVCIVDGSEENLHTAPHVA